MDMLNVLLMYSSGRGRVRGDLPCWGVVARRSSCVGELRSGGAVVKGSCSVGESWCCGVAVWVVPR